MDRAGHRLFIAALGNNTVEVIDLITGKRIHTITGLEEPQGILFLSDVNQVYVASGGSGTCSVFDGTSFTLIKQFTCGADADNLRFDAATLTIYVGAGNGLLGSFKARQQKRLPDIPLPGHPEAFQLEQTGPLGFVNIPEAHQIAVVDRQTHTVRTQWPLTNTANFPMALDESQHRLFVGFRQPARFMVFATATGQVVADLASVGDADDIFYDPRTKRMYVIGGEGFIAIFTQVDADQYQLTNKVPTAGGAQTGLFVPEWQQLLVAVPQRDKQDAEVRVYSVQP